MPETPRDTADQRTVLTPHTANRLHDAYCRWIDAAEHAQDRQQRYADLLTQICETLSLELPRQGRVIDLGRIEINFVECWLKITPRTVPAAVSKAAEEERGRVAGDTHERRANLS